MAHQEMVKLIPYRKGKKWGYCNPSRKLLIPWKYDRANTFREGMALVSAALCAQEPTLNFEVKFLRILMSSTGQYGLACPDAATKARLEGVGLNVAPTFKLGLATTEDEVRSLKKAGKLVVVTNPLWWEWRAAAAWAPTPLWLWPGPVSAS